MALITTLLTYLCKAVLFLAVAVAGFMAGKKFKASKVQKNSVSEE